MLGGIDGGGGTQRRARLGFGRGVRGSCADSGGDERDYGYKGWGKRVAVGSGPIQRWLCMIRVRCSWTNQNAIKALMTL